MYRDPSNISGDSSEARVYTDLIERGWIVNTPSSRDAVYDLLVDLGDKVFQTVQVKTMCKNSIAKIIDRSGERVSAHGKVRNSLDYAEHKIDWLAGVRKDGKIFYYKLDNYSKIPTKSFSVNRWDADDFPVSEVSRKRNKKSA